MSTEAKSLWQRLVRVLLYFALFGFFVVPIAAATEFSLRGPGGKGVSLVNFSWILHRQGFGEHILLSFKLAAMSVFLVTVLMVPTVVLINLSVPRAKRIVEFICIVPLVIPVVSLAIGAQVAMPTFMQNWQYELAFFYVIIALPYTYRALDVGVSAVPLRTLFDASRSLGATWTRSLIGVIFPAIRNAVLGAALLTVALALGEFTLTSLLHWDTFSTWTVTIAQENILGAIAISVLTLVGAIILLGLFSVFGHFRKGRAADA